MKGSEGFNALSFLTGKRLITLILAILCAGIIQKIPLSRKSRIVKLATGVFTLVLFALSIIFLVNGTYNPFIYFQF